MKLDALFQNPTALPTAPKVVEELISSFDKALSLIHISEPTRPY